MKIRAILICIIMIIIIVTYYSLPINEGFQYLSTPSYNTYSNLVESNLKSGPYYTFNKEKLDIPIFYNYLLPNIPPSNLSAYPQNNILQYWYTSQ